MFPHEGLFTSGFMSGLYTGSEAVLGDPAGSPWPVWVCVYLLVKLWWKGGRTFTFLNCLKCFGFCFVFLVMLLISVKHTESLSESSIK